MSDLNYPQKDLEKGADVDIDTDSVSANSDKLLVYEPRKQRIGETLLLAFTSLGAVYGDIGTSPLYVLNSIKIPHKVATRDDVYGCVSLIFWLFVILCGFKYAWIVLTYGPNDGEGGQVAIYAKIARHLGIGPKGVQIPGAPQVSDFELLKRTDTLSSANEDRPVRSWKRNPITLRIMSIVTLGLCFVGCALVISDGLLTPTTSVLSAVGGIQVAKPDFSQNSAIAVSEVVLLFLFAVQQFGSHKVSFAFAPIMTLWFIGLVICGIYNIAKYDPTVFRALSPYYAIKILRSCNIDSLGGAMLALTGTEAMFADLGHFGARPTQIGISFSLICLLLTYLGQGAYLTKYPEHIADAFYISIPGGPGSWFYWIMFVLAILACIIASQALILGVFSILSQLINLDCFPKVKIVRVSASYRGKVYIPLANFLLLVGVVAATAAFKNSNNVTAAYGFGISIDFAITSFLMVICMIFVYDFWWWIPLLFGAIFLPLELCLVIANAKKVPHGAWFPLMIAGLFVIIFVFWRYCRDKTVRSQMQTRVRVSTLFPQVTPVVNLGRSLDDVQTAADDDGDEDGVESSDLSISAYKNIMARYGETDFNLNPGVAMIYSDTPDLDVSSPNTVPGVYSRLAYNFASMPSIVIFCTMRSMSIPYVSEEDRILIGKIKIPGHYKCVLRFGFMEEMKSTPALQSDILHRIKEARYLTQSASKPVEVLHIFEKTFIRAKYLTPRDESRFRNWTRLLGWHIRSFAIERIFSPVNSVFENSDDRVATANPDGETNDKLFVGGVLRI